MGWRILVFYPEHYIVFLENVWFVLFLITNILSSFSRSYLELYKQKRVSEIVVTSEKSDEIEVFYTVKMASQENLERNALVRNKWMTMLGIIHYVLVNK